MWRRGYVVLRLFDEVQLAWARTRYVSVRDALPPGSVQIYGAPARGAADRARTEDLFGLEAVHRTEEGAALLRWVDQAPGEHWRRALRPELVPLPGPLLVKPPHGVATPFHLDATVIDPSRQAALRLWCPLVDVREDTGCMRVVPGSHRFSGYVRGWDQTLEEGPFAAVLAELLRHGVTVPLRAGEALLFHPGLIHASHAHQGDEPRVVLTTAFFQPGAELIQPIALRTGEVACYRPRGAEGTVPPRLADVVTLGAPDFIAVADGAARSFGDIAGFIDV